MTTISQTIASAILGYLAANPDASISQVYNKCYLPMREAGRGSSVMEFGKFADSYGFLMPSEADETVAAAAAVVAPEAEGPEEVGVGFKFVYHGKRRGNSTWIVTGMDGDTAECVKVSNATAAGKPKKGIEPNRFPNLAKKIGVVLSKKDSTPRFEAA